MYFEEDLILNEETLVVGRTLKPIDNHTGYAIVISIRDVPERYVGMLGEKQYKVLTDFGNTFNLTLGECLSMYTCAPRGVDNIIDRLNLQLELLGGVRDTLIKGE